MHCGVRSPKARHAVLPTSLVRDSDSWPEAGRIWFEGLNPSVLRWALHARGRNEVEGRIAECPRLQQNGSSDDLSFSCKNVGSSML